MDVLILGGAGQVGTELRALAWPAGTGVHAPSRSELDITDAGAVAGALDARAYGAVINTATYTQDALSHKIFISCKNLVHWTLLRTHSLREDRHCFA